MHKHVVIVGGGFGGLTAVQALSQASVDIVLVDAANHHLFQPLLYQVATAALSPGDIASPFRTILRRQRNVRVVFNEVTGIDRRRRVVQTADDELPFDRLVLAPGTHVSYYGRTHWKSHALGLKTIRDALNIRERVLSSFEQAERVHGTPQARPYLTFCVVGGGPTGVELAGAVAEIALQSLLPDFTLLRREDIAVVLLEAGTRILPGFHPSLSQDAQQMLEQLGVAVCLNCPVTDVTERGVQAGGKFIESVNILWAPGNRAPGFLSTLETPLSRSGSVIVEPDLSIPGDPWIFAIGDAAMALTEDGRPLPALAPVAMQEARFVARIIAGDVPPERRGRFLYKDHGSVATIGKAKAVAELGRFRTSGLFAWLLWSMVHIYSLIGFRNRFRVMFEWMWYYITFKPGARLLYTRAPQKTTRGNGA